MRIEIHKSSHHFLVKTQYRQISQLICRFAENYEEWEWKKQKGQRAQRVLVRSFVVSNEIKSSFRFHINCFDEFIKFLKWNRIDDSLYKVHEPIIYTPKSIEIEDVCPYNPREEQVPLIKYLALPGAIKLLTLQTGKGKTYCLLQALVEIKQRAIICVPSRYIERWVGDLTGKDKVVSLEESDLLIIAGKTGTADLCRWIAKAKLGELTAKVILLSSNTMQNYLKAFQEDPVEALRMYGCEPDKLMQLFEVGILGRDEVHEMFHHNFLVDLHINVPKTISLSATIEFDNKMSDKMARLMFPKHMQVNNGEWDKYIEAVGLYYSFVNPKLIKTSYNGMSSYSHGAFEKSIMKNPTLLENYLAMIKELVFDSYQENGEGEKILVFAYTVDMCTLIANLLEETMEDVIVNRYVSEDEYEVLLGGDISVSTLKSAGTAVDIPMLQTVIMTTAIFSTQSNIQALGRLRKPKHTKVAPRFYYLICKDIQKHLDYHEHKVTKFKDKVLSHTTQRTDFYI